MNDRQRKLFLDILGCSHFVEYHTTDRAIPNCGRILSVQSRELENAQVPEPWNGNLSARILFLSSNPSLDREELYPRGRPAHPSPEPFFVRRFSGLDPSSGKRWVNEQFHVLWRDGEHGPSPHYWTEIRYIAEDLLGVSLDVKDLDSAICLSEVVHCKSKGNHGVIEAAPTCTQLFLRRLLELSKATVIIVYGEARDLVWHLVERTIRPADVRFVGPRIINGRPRAFVYLPAPGSGEKRKLSVALDADDFARLRILATVDENSLRNVMSSLEKTRRH